MRWLTHSIRLKILNVICVSFRRLDNRDWNIKKTKQLELHTGNIFVINISTLCINILYFWNTKNNHSLLICFSFVLPLTICSYLSFLILTFKCSVWHIQWHRISSARCASQAVYWTVSMATFFAMYQKTGERNIYRLTYLYRFIVIFF